ncbi:hypothetical protein SRABI112_00842 [Pseudomonas mediterranea]|nr:hypothetical protein SRABI112_00842 [Pseudomonas mediterranea]
MNRTRNHGIKRRWNPEQFAKRSACKKQVNVLLPIILIARINSLAKQHGVKRAQIIEAPVSSNSDASVPLHVD